ncbi:MAG: PilZ domain-containing protein [Myxococcales bacterium]|nr:PilZ domain-containing protein [Myxococcota bacterium]MDW8283027.1 PilZ domain-containing protein [Myxococcales bacterium]
MNQARATPAAPPSERRQWERSPVVVTAEMVLRDEMFAALAQNISGGGMFLQAPEPLSVGDHIRLRFSLPGLRPLEVDAEVVWAAPKKKTYNSRPPFQMGVGVKFINLSEAERAEVMEYVRALMRR